VEKILVEDDNFDLVPHKFGTQIRTVSSSLLDGVNATYQINDLRDTEFPVIGKSYHISPEKFLILLLFHF